MKTLSRDVIIRLNLHMNAEFSSASLYFSRSSLFVTNGLFEAGEILKLLAEESLYKTMKFYKYLEKNHGTPFLNDDTALSNDVEMPIDMALKESMSLYEARHASLAQLDELAVFRADLRTACFLFRLRSSYHKERDYLRSVFMCNKLRFK